MDLSGVCDILWDYRNVYKSTETARIANEQVIYSYHKKFNVPFLRQWFIQHQPTLESNKATILIEPRDHPQLEFTILCNIHMTPGWKHYIFHSAKNAEAVKRIVSPWHESVYLLECLPDQLDGTSYSRFICNKALWELVEADYVLIYQTDSYLRRRGIDLFCDSCPIYGAPWSWDKDDAGNGGLSLRRREDIIRILDTCPYDNKTYEDRFFANGIKTLGYVLSPYEHRIQFCTESCWQCESLGVHQFWTYIYYFHNLEHTFSDPESLFKNYIRLFCTLSLYTD